MFTACGGMYFWLALDWWIDRSRGKKAIMRKHDRLTGPSALVRAPGPSRGSLPSEVLERERQAAMWRDERRARKAAQHADWTRQFLDLVQPFKPAPVPLGQKNDYDFVAEVAEARKRDRARGNNVVRVLTNDDGDTIELRSWGKYRTNNEERLCQLHNAIFDGGPVWHEENK